MRVVVCGGSKTQNIVSVLEKMFKSSGVDFITLKYLDEVSDIFVRGDYFDRAILIEQSWTLDNSRTDETEIRAALNNFANEMSSQNPNSGADYVFLSQSAQMATIVSEEILSIKSCSELTVKEPPYRANLFRALVVAELGNFPKDIVFIPSDTISSDDKVEIEGDSDTEFRDLTPEDMELDRVNNANRLPNDNGIGVNDFDEWLNGGASDPEADFGDEAPQDFDNAGFDNKDGDFTEDTGDFEQFSEEQAEFSGFEDNFSGGFEDFSSEEPTDVRSEDTEGMSVNNGNDFEDFGSDFDNFGSDFDNLSTETPSDSDAPSDDIQPGNGFDDFGGIPQDDFGGIPQDDFGWTDDSGINFVKNEELQGSNEDGNKPNINLVKGNNVASGSDDPMGGVIPNIGEIPDYSGEDPGFKGIPNDEYEDYGNTEDYEQQDDFSQQGDYDQQDNLGYPTNDAGDYDQPYSEDYGQQIPYDNQYDPYYNGDNIGGEIPGGEPQGSQIEFDSSDYSTDKTQKEDSDTDSRAKSERPNNKHLRDAFKAFASRGNSIVVTGCGGAGTSTIAMNLANIICNMGYTVLLVDMDTVNKAQSYITKDQFDAVDVESASIMSAVNSNSGINAYISIIRQGFHLLTMGMASDARDIDEAFKKDKIARFINMAKANHNFVIYDVPFNAATKHLDQLIYTADNVVLNVDYSSWGIAKMMLAICNIGSDDMEETLFSRGQILFNKYRPIKKIMGKKIKKPSDVTEVMDKKMFELLGEDPGYYFSDMHICGTIPFDLDFEAGWFEEMQYSDSKKGNDAFIKVLKNIVLHT